LARHSRVSASKPRDDRWTIAARYHERTKHRYEQFARSPERLDWENEPAAFRRFAGAALFRLPLPAGDRTPPYEAIYRTGSIAPQPVSLDALSRLFFYSLAVSAWKSAGGARWALRVNPSSGNLHPTEGYLAVYGLEGLTSAPGVYHYAPEEHALERRCEFAPGVWERLAAGLPAGAFFVGLSSIAWRESWKYGERAFRYCQLDVGHALAALRVSAAMLGWRLFFLPNVADEETSRLLGLERREDFVEREREAPGLLAAVAPGGEAIGPLSFRLNKEAVAGAAAGPWFGKANRLSPNHQPWDVIDEVERACRKEPGGPPEPPAPPHGAQGAAGADGAEAEFRRVPCGKSAGRIVRQRRSAAAMDGETGISRGTFYGMLGRLLPALSDSPWDCLTWPPFVHLKLFAHRVEGLAPGLYALARDGRQTEALKAAMKPSFRWERPADCPSALPLFLLEERDVQVLAVQLSCGQDIAGEGAFSLGMIAAFEGVLRRCGAHFYRRLFWEAGMIGQVLYLEAEAAGARATGIGCYFDDPVHEVFGLRGQEFQSLYHLTVGGPLEDRRPLQTEA